MYAKYGFYCMAAALILGAAAIFPGRAGAQRGRTAPSVVGDSTVNRPSRGSVEIQTNRRGATPVTERVSGDGTAARHERQTIVEYNRPQEGYFRYPGSTRPGEDLGGRDNWPHYPRRQQCDMVDIYGYRYNYWYQPWGAVVIYADDGVDTEVVSEVVERSQRQWVPGHYEQVMVEDPIEGETVEVHHPAVYERQSDGSLKLLEKERTERQPKVRLILTQRWVEGHYEYGEAEED